MERKRASNASGPELRFSPSFCLNRTSIFKEVIFLISHSNTFFGSLYSGIPKRSIPPNLFSASNTSYSVAGLRKMMGTGEASRARSDNRYLRFLGHLGFDDSVALLALLDRRQTSRGPEWKFPDQTLSGYSPVHRDDDESFLSQPEGDLSLRRSP